MWSFQQKMIVSGCYKKTQTFVFLHDLRLKTKKREANEKKGKEWVCDETRILSPSVRKKLTRLLQKECDQAKRKGRKRPVS